jgi:hypothetical protein
LFLYCCFLVASDFVKPGQEDLIRLGTGVHTGTRVEIEKDADGRQGAVVVVVARASFQSAEEYFRQHRWVVGLLLSLHFFPFFLFDDKQKFRCCVVLTFTERNQVCAFDR